MTKCERVKQALQADKDHDNPADLDALIELAYYYGAETAARRVCDEHNRRGADAIARAKSIRYYRMAMQVLGDAGNVIYDTDYAGDMMTTFGQDECTI